MAKPFEISRLNQLNTINAIRCRCCKALFQDMAE